eukprot:COSAG01_NODE_72595_length_252_cov_1.339869_1_plen_41_part_10
MASTLLRSQYCQGMRPHQRYMLPQRRDWQSKILSPTHVPVL